jgi:hypothetical protein
MNGDEGFYAIAARSAMEGRLPYRDFAYTQMPFLPYLNGIAMRIVGFGMTEQRLINAFWVALGLSAVVWAMRSRLADWEPAFLAAFALFSSPHFIYYSVIGKTYGAAFMFVAFGVAALLAPFSFRLKTALFLACVVGAVGVRLSCAPFMAVMGLWLLIEAPTWKARFLVTGVAVLSLVVALGAFLALSPQAAFFNVWQYHLASAWQRPWQTRVSEWWPISPTAVALMILGLVCIPTLFRKREWGAIVLLVAALVAMVLPMLPQSSYGEYVTPSVILASVAGVLGVWLSSDVRAHPARHFIWIFPLAALAQPLPAHHEQSAASDVKQVARFIAQNAKDGPILTPMPIIAVEAGRPVIARTEMGMFSTMAAREADKAEAVQFTTLPEITGRVSSKEPTAIAMLAGDSRWNFEWIVPSLSRQPQKARHQLWSAIYANYRGAKRFGQIVVYLPR